MKFKRLFALLLALLAAFTAVSCACRERDRGTQGEQSDVVILPTANITEAPEQPTADLTGGESAAPASEAPATPEATPAPTDEPTAAPTEAPTAAPTPQPTPAATEPLVAEDGVYDSRDDVALYIHLYGHLPSNYITKREAQELGWTGGSLEPYAPGKCIGGDRFGNYEGQLPTRRGRTYYECDIGTLGRSSRGAKRIVYSNDGLIYYTGDHYEHFTLLYGGDN